jgi:hypothetical protein
MLGLSELWIAIEHRECIVSRSDDNRRILHEIHESELRKSALTNSEHIAGSSAA